MTRYFSSYPTSYLDSYFVQCNFDGSYHHSEVPIICTAQLVPECHIQCAVMPTTYTTICIELLLAKCMSKAISDDHADQRPFQVYVNSYLALLNAHYYLQPDSSDTADISEFRAHRPASHNRELEDEKHQNSSRDVCRLPYDQLYPTRPVQAVMVGNCITVDRRD
jgi:hypothetical protein